jgi:hypothetical protein
MASVALLFSEYGGLVDRVVRRHVRDCTEDTYDPTSLFLQKPTRWITSVVG